MAFHVGSAFQALDDLLEVLALPRSVSMGGNKDVASRTIMDNRREAAKRQACHSHIEAATSALSRCGLEEEPIRYMIRSISRLVPPETTIGQLGDPRS